MAALVWRIKAGRKQTSPIVKAITTIGATVENDICIADGGLRSHHAQLVFDTRHFTLSNVDENGDFLLNNKRKRRSAKLSHGDLVQMGDVTMQFDMLGQVAATDTTSTNDRIGLDGLTKLQRFSLALMSSDSVETLLNELMDAIIDLTSAAKGFLILFEEDTPVIKVARNLRQENISLAVTGLSDSIVSQVVNTREAIIVANAQSDEQFSGAQSVINLKLNSVMCVPLLARKNLLGLIYVGNDSVRGLFESHMLEILKVFAAQASLLVQNALLVDDLKLRNVALREELNDKHFGEIIGTSKEMEDVFQRVKKVSQADVSVLISGETGTGKELIAREIHRRSDRCNGPFVTVNCGAIPEPLMESEFFGHAKGAFTGADTTRDGKFQSADGGTIFLDEIGEMPLSLQVKMLRVLQEHQVIKVGATRTEFLNIRVLAATNRNLEAEIKTGGFREDLYYRLNVIHIELPPLRDRSDDVVLLARFLLKRFTREFDSHVKGLSPSAVAAIRRHRWPGNVRELENRLKKAIILCDDTLVGPDDLDLSSDDIPSRNLTLAQARDQFQKAYIIDALDRNDGSRSRAAKELDVDPRTIYRYLERK